MSELHTVEVTQNCLKWRTFVISGVPFQLSFIEMWTQMDLLHYAYVNRTKHESGLQVTNFGPLLLEVQKPQRVQHI
jgi:hypothetical protein